MLPSKMEFKRDKYKILHMAWKKNPKLHKYYLHLDGSFSEKHLGVLEA